MELKDNLIRLREAKKWSQSELAHRAGVSQQTIAAIESGRTRRPREIFAIAAATLCVFLLFSARPPMIAGLPYTIIGLVFLVPIGIWRGRKNRSKKS